MPSSLTSDYHSLLHGFILDAATALILCHSVVSSRSRSPQRRIVDCSVAPFRSRPRFFRCIVSFSTRLATCTSRSRSSILQLHVAPFAPFRLDCHSRFLVVHVSMSLCLITPHSNSHFRSQRLSLSISARCGFECGPMRDPKCSRPCGPECGSHR